VAHTALDMRALLPPCIGCVVVITTEPCRRGLTLRTSLLRECSLAAGALAKTMRPLHRALLVLLAVAARKDPAATALQLARGHLLAAGDIADELRGLYSRACRAAFVIAPCVDG
jgi:hypothetical protein